MKNFEYNLKQLLETEIDPELFPLSETNRIRIGRYVIEFGEQYVVRHPDYIFPLGKTYTKHGALALVKSVIRQRNNREKIYRLDRQLYHDGNDLVFFKNVINRGKHAESVAVAQIRYEIAVRNVKTARKLLASMI